ncbi:MAG: hypothetical protein V1837_03815 [Candidatus Woesearchaeota archaeon]
MNRKGFIHHPFFMGVIAFFVGLIVMYLIAKGIIPINLGICPK